MERDILESRIYRSPCLKKNEKWSGYVYEGKFTMTETFEEVVRLFPDNEVYGVRKNSEGEFDYMTYKTVWETCKAIAAGLERVLKKISPASRIGIIMETQRAWNLMEHACFMLNFVAVGISPNTGPFSLINAIRENEMEAVVVHVDQLSIIEEIADACQSLEKVILVGGKYGKDEEIKPRKTDMFEIIPFEYLLHNFKNLSDSFKINYPKPDDVCVQIYTSGSTGESKGVQLTHRNMIYCISSIIDNNEGFKFTPSLNYVSFLPLSHMNEQTVHHVFFFVGSRIAYGSVKTLMSRENFRGDLRATNPVIFSGVPRVWETLKKAILLKVSNYNFFWNYIFYHFLEKRLNSLKSGKNEEFYFESMVFSKIRSMFGSEIKVICSGSSPLSAETQFFMQAIMGKDIIFSQAYGLSETVSAVAMQSGVNFEGVNNVGKPLKGVEMKLVDCPDFGYFTHELKKDSGNREIFVHKEEPEGEVYIRTGSIFKGYYKKDKATKQMFHEDWLVSGDIGRFTKDGKLRIIDRVKNVVKIGNGLFVAVEALESIYVGCEFIKPNGICVVPNGYKSFLCCIALIDPNYVKNYVSEKFSDEEEDIQEILKKYEKEIKSGVLLSLKHIAEKNRMKKYEYIIDVAIYDDDWNPLNGLTSNAFKLFRRKIAKKYEGAINKMYYGSENISENKKQSEIPESEIIENLRKIFPPIAIENVNCEEVYPKLVKFLKLLDRNFEDIDFDKSLPSLGIDSLTTVLLINYMKANSSVSVKVKVSQLAMASLKDIIYKFFFLRNIELGISVEEEIEGEEEEECVDIHREFKKLEVLISQIILEERKKPESKSIVKDDKKNEKSLFKIFMTGTTGFLGNEIVRDLLFKNQNIQLYCLIRLNSGNYKPFVEKFKKEIDNQKIVIIFGDLLKKPLFELEEEIEFNLILHCGSYVNHFYNYHDLYDANVSSFYEILKISKCKIPIHYVSSTAIYLANKEESRDDISVTNYFHKFKEFPVDLGYAASKFMCDNLSTKTNLILKKRLISIHRPSFLGPSRRVNGYSREFENNHNSSDWPAVFIKEIIRYNLTCDDELMFKNPFDMIPVNICSFLITSVIEKYIREKKEKVEEFHDNQEDIIFEYSLKNCSLFEISEFLESLKNSKFERIHDFNVFKKMIEEKISADNNSSKLIIPFLEVIDSSSLILKQFQIAGKQAGINKNLRNFVLEEYGEDFFSNFRKYTEEELKNYLLSLDSEIDV